MNGISYRRHRFTTPIIQHAVWLYFRFTLSYRDAEDLPTECGIDVSYETIRRWALKFGQAYAGRLRNKQPRLGDRSHLAGVCLPQCPQPALVDGRAQREPDAVGRLKTS